MLRLRIVSALVMATCLLGALVWLPLHGWATFVLIVLAVGAWEWGGFSRLQRGGRVSYVVLIVAACVLAAWFCGMSSRGLSLERLHWFYWPIATFWFIAGPVWVVRFPQHPPRWLLAVMGLLVLVPVFLALIDLRSIGADVLLAVMGLVWVADIVAYFAGRAYGRRKLAAAVSPGKTIEGAVGALIGVAFYASVISILLPHLGRTMGWTVLGAIVLACLSIVGDLFESALKRQAGLKDSGNVLPGHGGVLDRIDALLPVLPIAALALFR